jgi:hypothetical protein
MELFEQITEEFDEIPDGIMEETSGTSASAKDGEEYNVQHNITTPKSNPRRRRTIFQMIEENEAKMKKALAALYKADRLNDIDNIIEQLKEDETISWTRRIATQKSIGELYGINDNNALVNIFNYVCCYKKVCTYKNLLTQKSLHNRKKSRKEPE